MQHFTYIAHPPSNWPPPHPTNSSTQPPCSLDYQSSGYNSYKLSNQVSLDNIYKRLRLYQNVSLYLSSEAGWISCKVISYIISVEMYNSPKSVDLDSMGTLVIWLSIFKKIKLIRCCGNDVIQLDAISKRWKIYMSITNITICYVTYSS